MKIYNKRAFFAGILFACAAVLFLFGLSDVHWWQGLFAIVITVRFLYVGLTEAGNTRAQKQASEREKAAAALCGKHHAYKRNLPLLLVAVFFPTALFLRLVFHIYLPVGIFVVFVLLLAVATAYSIGIERSIEEYIDTHPEDDAPDAP